MNELVIESEYYLLPAHYVAKYEPAGEGPERRTAQARRAKRRALVTHSDSQARARTLVRVRSPQHWPP